MTWTLSISCLSSVVDYEENLFERFEKNAPDDLATYTKQGLSLYRYLLVLIPVSGMYYR
jgi:hypothetical protein